MYLSIYVAIYLHTVISGLAAQSDWDQFDGQPEDDYRMNTEIHSEAMMERVWRFNLRPKLSELGEALAGRDWASLEKNLEAEFM